MRHVIAVAIAVALLGCSEAKKPAPAPPDLPLPKRGNDAAKPAGSELNLGSEKQVSIVPPPPAAALAPPGETTLVDVDLAGFQKQLAAFGGKHVVVDAWATWCVPCRAKFPKFVELAGKSPKDKFVFLSLAVDEPDAAKAREFLAGVRAAFVNLRLAGVASAAWQKSLGFATVPHYLIYDGAGKAIFRSDRFEALEAKLNEMEKQ